MKAQTIILLTKNFPPVICGVGDYTHELYWRLKTLGYNVKVITGANQSVNEYILEKEIQNDIFPIVENWGAGAMGSIRKIVRQEKPDWFVLQYVPYSFSRWGAPLWLIPFFVTLRLQGIKTSVFFHEVVIRWLHNGFFNFFLSPVQRGLAYGLHFLSKHAFTSSTFYAKYFWPFGISVQPIPANIYLSKPSPELKNSNAINLVSFVNRCRPLVTEAIFKCIAEDHLNIELTVVGRGFQDAKNRIKSDAKAYNLLNRIAFLEESDAESIAKCLSKTDVFIQMEYVSSRGEGGISSKSGVVAAALAAGIPIIATEGDMTDTQIFQNSENIFFADSFSAESLQVAINKLYLDPVLRNKLAKNARQSYESFFSWDRTLQLYHSKFSG